MRWLQCETQSVHHCRITWASGIKNESFQGAAAAATSKKKKGAEEEDVGPPMKFNNLKDQRMKDEKQLKVGTQLEDRMNSMRLEQNGWHLTDNVFRCFLDWK